MLPPPLSPMKADTHNSVSSFIPVFAAVERYGTKQKRKSHFGISPFVAERSITSCSDARSWVLPTCGENFPFGTFPSHCLSRSLVLLWCSVRTHKIWIHICISGRKRQKWRCFSYWKQSYDATVTCTTTVLGVLCTTKLISLLYVFFLVPTMTSTL